MLGKNVYIVDAVRTPIGKFLGQYKDIEASQLGALVIKSLLKRNKLDIKSIDEIILGQVLTAGVGMNPARQTALLAGLSNTTPAYTINQVCGSGLRAIINGAYAIINEEANLVIAGGQENMTRARHTILSRIPKKLGDTTLTDSLQSDGLVDYFNNYAMGVTAENVAQKYKITRKQQDQFAYHSQKKAALAIEKKIFDAELVNANLLEKIKLKNFTDEHPRTDITENDLADLKPVFQKEGTVTAGNSSGINDGAAAIILASTDALNKYNFNPMAQILGWSHSAIEPKFMGIGPISATQKLLKKLNLSITDLDLIENNEAFAATSIAVNQQLQLNEKKTNVNGGAIALGHPIGTSGSRILTTLSHELKRRQQKKGLATMCIGGGMGIALIIENLINN